MRAVSALPEEMCMQHPRFAGDLRGLGRGAHLRAPVTQPCSRVWNVAQTAASLTFLMNTNTGVFLNVNAFLCPLLDACVVRAQCGGRAQPLEFSSRLRGLFLFCFFFFSSPAELALEFEVQHDFLEVAEEEPCTSLSKSASFREIIYLPPRE